MHDLSVKVDKLEFRILAIGAAMVCVQLATIVQIWMK